MPTHYATKAISVNETWGKRCNRLLFVSTPSNQTTDLPIVTFNLKESRSILTNKTMLAFEYVYKNHFDEADWFIKADDDTYVIMENLRHLLKDTDPEKRIHFGHQFKEKNDTWFSGGSGYVLSKAALRRYVTLGRNNNTLCPWIYSEDYYMGYCMAALGVTNGNTGDKSRKPSFLPLGFGTHLSNIAAVDWYKRISTSAIENGDNCCHKYLISIHYVSPLEMHKLDWLIYHLRLHRPSSRRRGDRDFLNL
ncbi:glycoprotein-N-acetylgalactosamine 3-beta-galactosyltransferase 1-like [Lineus longissimus]|uniref:glycoprotein-N-acetylgalactosamine 3-beta-galactosyltransferase 1-like n=1 Tax=Lineus longissimus TaxID=88925 RepID=UPI00315C4F2D